MLDTASSKLAEERIGYQFQNKLPATLADCYIVCDQGRPLGHRVKQMETEDSILEGQNRVRLSGLFLLNAFISLHAAYIAENGRLTPLGVR